MSNKVSNNTFASYFNPVDKNHHSYIAFKKLSVPRKILVLFAAIFGSILPIAGNCALFRKVTQLLTPSKTASVVRYKFVNQPKRVKISPFNSALAEKVVNETNKFNFYTLSQTETAASCILTGASLRPSNFFFTALGIDTTLPNHSGYPLFSLKNPERVKENLKKKAIEAAEQAVLVTAKGFDVILHARDQKTYKMQAEKVFGTNEFRISYGEIQQTLDSQKIYLSDDIPRLFYVEFKKAITKDNISVFPWGEEKNYTVEQLMELKITSLTNLTQFLQEVKKDPKKFGFTSESWDRFTKLTIYEIGSMVVKTEEYRIMADGGGKIFERKVGDKDAFQLINACGIRGFAGRSNMHAEHKHIMTNTFKTVMKSAHDGILIIPATGLGVWKGDPEVYWGAFFDALLSSPESFDKIYVNPGHAPTPDEYTWKGRTGDEFEAILKMYLSRTGLTEFQRKKLLSIENLHTKQTDIVQLARNLKRSMPDVHVSLMNASDPDVTLGNHVGEYVNNCPHTHTTEENYTALGTNGLCFEAITGVHEDPKRIIALLK